MYCNIGLWASSVIIYVEHVSPLHQSGINIKVVMIEHFFTQTHIYIIFYI
jgi:hypothetical protein